MKQIKLTQGQFSLVDDKDYEQLSQRGWFAQWNSCTQSFYACRNSKTKTGKRHQVSMAREILGLEYGDKRQADHIGHDTLDNQRSNLRAVTHQQNQCNQRNVRGYFWNKGAKKYQAQIRLNGKAIYLGLFLKAEVARNAYLQAKASYHKIQVGS